MVIKANNYGSDFIAGRYYYGSISCSSGTQSRHMALAAILIFDVEAMFMFPWAVIVREMGVDGLLNILFFLLILVLGLAYAWKKGALEWK